MVLELLACALIFAVFHSDELRMQGARAISPHGGGMSKQKSRVRKRRTTRQCEKPNFCHLLKFRTQHWVRQGMKPMFVFYKSIVNVSRIQGYAIESHVTTFGIRDERPSKLPASCLIGIPDGEATMERPPTPGFLFLASFLQRVRWVP